MLRSLFTLSCFLCASSLAQAGLTLDPGTTLETNGISTFVTGGNDMVGMKVTVTFSDGSMEMATWMATVGDAGAATGTGWFLSFDGPDTYNSGDVLSDLSHAFQLSNNSGLGIVSVLLNGQPGKTVFDISEPGFAGVLGTTNSAFGETFKEVADNGLGGFTTTSNGNFTGLNVDVTYRDYVALAGQSPVGDLFARMQIDFTDNGGMLSGTNYFFLADTDNSTTRLENPVPEPSSMALAALGLLSGCGIARRRRAAA